MTTMNSSLKTGLVVLAVCGMALTVVSGPVAAQSTAVVAFDSGSVTFEDSTTTELVVSDAPDNGIGAYKLNLTYNSDDVNISVSGTDRYDVSTATTGSSGNVTTTVVGYTGAANGTAGETTLANVTVTANTDSGDTTLAVSTIETFTDTDGNAIAYTNNASIDLAVESGGGGGGGGGFGGGLDEPTTDAPTTDTPTSGTTDTPGPTATDAPDDQPTAADDTATSAATEEQSTESTGGSGPGFGVAAAVIAGLAAAGLAARRRP